MTELNTATSTHPDYAVTVAQTREIRCPMCGTLAFKIVGDYIEIRQRHHGEQHQWMIPLADLLEQAK